MRKSNEILIVLIYFLKNRKLTSSFTPLTSVGLKVNFRVLLNNLFRDCRHEHVKTPKNRRRRTKTNQINTRKQSFDLFKVGRKGKPRLRPTTQRTQQVRAGACVRACARKGYRWTHWAVINAARVISTQRCWFVSMETWRAHSFDLKSEQKPKVKPLNNPLHAGQFDLMRLHHPCPRPRQKRPSRPRGQATHKLT